MFFYQATIYCSDYNNMEIPGLPSNKSGNIDTEQIIQNLLAAERIPITNLEEEVKENKNKITLWQDIENSMEKLQSAARDIYKLNNSFDTLSVSSDEPSILYTSVRRGALTGDFLVTVKQTANADRWISEYIPEDYKVKKGVYTLAIGKERVSVKTNETSISNFVEQLNKKAKNILTAKILRKGSQKKEQVLLLESLKIGKNQKLRLSKNFETLALDLQLIEYKQDTASHEITLNTQNIDNAISDKNLFFDTIIKNTNASAAPQTVQLRLHPGALGTVRISGIPQKFFNSEKAILKLSFIFDTIQDNATNTNKASSIDQQQKETSPTPLSATLEDVSIPFSKINNLITTKKNTHTLPILLSDTDTVSKSNAILLSINTNNISKNTTVSTEIDLTQVTEDNELVFTVVNPFTNYDIQYTKAIIFEESSTSTLAPKNPVSLAQNAIITYNGIEIERENNDISDVIPGLTLHLKKKSEKTVTISVINNVEDAKNDIIYFIGHYNQLMQKLNIYSSSRIGTLNDISFETQEERNKASDNLGKLSSNFGLSRVITDIEQITTQQYPNPIDTEFTSLRTIGIESNFGSSQSVAGNRYLNIDDTKLNNSLESSFEGVRYLFAVDRTNDFSIDYGIAFLIYDKLEKYLQINGLIQQRINSLNRDIRTKERRITASLTELDRTEKNLRRKYGLMQQSLSDLESTQNTLNLFNNNNNNR